MISQNYYLKINLRSQKTRPKSSSILATFHSLFNWFMFCYFKTSNLPNGQNYFESFVSMCVDKLNQRNTLWRTVVQTVHPGITLSLYELRVWFPAVLAPRAFLISSGNTTKIQKKEDKLNTFLFFPPLVNLFCWDQPTTTSARLRTLDTRPAAHPPVHLCVKWDHPVPWLVLFCSSFQWKIGRRGVTAQFQALQVKNIF